ncbi:GTP-binding protein HSR1 [Thiorhodococcus mannitoliphagus]|uniref:GTP-binding protein HSR1 n=1 Tax=Thiorhodococcus mannitoliphagus TaxID=329406 RepID=A0A6P1E165_9GAMM|nr:GTPase [Thiorhodococcus mannitoliphagus]NEX22222.1 GTP-binding protein HSR1 [Thiorhodococcus mannitoliphagus]
MKRIISRIDGPWLGSLLLWALPIAALMPLGLLWLHEKGLVLVWIGSLLLLSAAGFGLQYWLKDRQLRKLDAASTRPDPSWPPVADGAWAAVEDLADQIEPQDWPLEDGTRLGELAQVTLERVASYFHPQVEQPLLELRIPHALLVIERASRDLRETIIEQIPFSHRLTIGSLARAYRWKPFAERLLGMYRAGQWMVNPPNALLNEAWIQLRKRGFALAQQDVYRWLLREYVRKVGRYAIDLYSGRLLLTDENPVKRITQASREDLELAVNTESAKEEALAGEPLRILVLGRSNAGKSSLINMLFGQMRAATDILPETTRALMPYRLERDGLELGLIFDSPGSERLARKTLHEAVTGADMILWVSAAHRPDRQSERQTLDALRAAQAERVDRRAPPLIVVVTHIDRLRPLREWLPPYDLTDSSNLKAMSIQAAVTALAADLDVPIANVIPVCLAEGRLYNVEDTLWTAILDQMDRAQRTRLLRCQDERRREENWNLLRRQLANAGRFLLALPRRMSRNG